MSDSLIFFDKGLPAYKHGFSKLFNETDVLILQRAYQKVCYPPDAEVAALAKELAVTEKQIRTWFKRRREAGKRRKGLRRRK